MFSSLIFVFWFINTTNTRFLGYIHADMYFFKFIPLISSVVLTVKKFYFCGRVASVTYEEREQKGKSPKKCVSESQHHGYGGRKVKQQISLTEQNTANS